MDISPVFFILVKKRLFGISEQFNIHIEWNKIVEHPGSVFNGYQDTLYEVIYASAPCYKSSAFFWPGGHPAAVHPSAYYCSKWKAGPARLGTSMRSDA
jgi:hypothetical protein